MNLRDRHLFGVGAAACAVCCAVPLLALLGIADAAATVATFIRAGLVFGLVVAAAALLAVWRQRRQQQEEARTPDTATGPVDLESPAKRPGSAP